MANYLGLDYGKKHLGLAYAQGPLAEPLKTVPTSTVDDALPLLISQYQITHLVIGLSENILGRDTKAFGAKLHLLTGLPVIYQDETLSSYETRLKMAKAGKKKQKREEKIDHLVAATILQDYLDSQTNDH